MPIITHNKWYNSNKLDIARYQENRLYEPELNGKDYNDINTYVNNGICNDDTSDDSIINMLKKDISRNLDDMIVNSNGDIVAINNTTNTDNVGNIGSLKELGTQWFSLPTEKEQTMYKRKNIKRYTAILKSMEQFKLRKTKNGEDEPMDSPESMVSTIRMSKLDSERFNKMSLMYLIMLNEGKLWLEFNDHINAQVFYRRKDRAKSLTAENSRCLADCDNLLKIICRNIKYNILDEVFVQGRVNVNINRAKRCFVKYHTDNDNNICRKLCFDSVANIGCILHKTDHPYMLLDLSNAYNNVLFPMLHNVISQYLPDPDSIHPDAKNGNFNMFYDIRNDQELKNISQSMTYLIQQIKYFDKGLGVELQRNKGVPQGSALSIDLFIICMDYILKECIDRLRVDLDLKYNRDYKIIVYVDDILILLKTEKAYMACTDMLDIINQTFASHHFKMNPKKSKCSPILADKYGCDVQIVKPSDKYLGIFIERDLNKYMALVEKEMATRYHYNPNMQSFVDMDRNILNMKIHERAQVRGKLQFMLCPFAKDKVEKGNVMIKLGYNNIAKLFADDSIDLSIISPVLDTDQSSGPNRNTTYKIFNNT